MVYISLYSPSLTLVKVIFSAKSFSAALISCLSLSTEISWPRRLLNPSNQARAAYHFSSTPAVISHSPERSSSVAGWQFSSAMLRFSTAMFPCGNTISSVSVMVLEISYLPVFALMVTWAVLSILPGFTIIQMASWPIWAPPSTFTLTSLVEMLHFLPTVRSAAFT